MDEKILCVTCRREIPADRLEALATLNKLPHEYTCFECAPNNKVKGIFLGESGNSQLVVTDNLGGKEGILREKIETVFDN